MACSPEVKKAGEAGKCKGLRLPGLPGCGERVMGLEPTTATLATWRSTTELHPRLPGIIKVAAAISRGEPPSLRPGDGLPPGPPRPAAKTAPGLCRRPRTPLV